MVYLFIGNLARLVAAWADRQADRHERHIIDLFSEGWTHRPPKRLLRPVQLDRG